jgi:hypothetical protein
VGRAAAEDEQPDRDAPAAPVEFVREIESDRRVHAVAEDAERAVQVRQQAVAERADELLHAPRGPLAQPRLAPR